MAEKEGHEGLPLGFCHKQSDDTLFELTAKESKRGGKVKSSIEFEMPIRYRSGGVKYAVILIAQRRN